jgi:hypothetical protein
MQGRKDRWIPRLEEVEDQTYPCIRADCATNTWAMLVVKEKSM